MNIPKSFELFGTTINIVWDDKLCNAKGIYGRTDYSLSRITLSTHHGVNPLSEDKIADTFYHEKVHIILDTIGEEEISKNEKFVDIFAKILRQSDESAVFEKLTKKE